MTRARGVHVECLFAWVTERKQEERLCPPLLACKALDKITIYGIYILVVTPPWKIEFYESDDDGCPVQDFLDELDKPRRAKVVALIALLEERGPTLPFLSA